MKNLSDTRSYGSRAWWIFATVSLFFFFVTAATFTSLGVVLYIMAPELHWTMSEAGLSFALVGLTCGLASPLPAWLMKWLGTRWTLFLAGVVLTAGFALASVSHGLGEFYVATGLMGAGFTLAAPVPAVYLLATWFPNTSGRMIGFYFMMGGLGGVVGPLLVNAIVQMSGWRFHWAVTAIAASVIGIVCALAAKDAVPVHSTEEVNEVTQAPPPDKHAPKAGQLTARQAYVTRQFITIALAMLVIQTVVTTIHGLVVTYLGGLGASAAFGSLIMSIIGLTDSVAKGMAGGLAERLGAKVLFVGGICVQCASLLLLGMAGSHAVAISFALLFGIGWGACWVSAHLLLLEYFGRNVAPNVIATATLITTAGVLGPIGAGRMGDAYGTLAPFFYILAALMLVAGVVTAAMRAPTPVRSTDGADLALRPTRQT